MARIFGFVALLIALLIGLYIHTRDMRSIAPGAEHGPTSVRASADLTAVKMDLNSFATAERQHMVSDGHYVSLDELLAKDSGLPSASRGDYSYSIELSGNGFTVTGTYTGPPMQNLPATIQIDQDGMIR